jgi:type I restriction enzyme S subunit
LENLGIPLPSLSKQKEVVVHLDQLLEKTKELKSNYQAQLDNIEEMRKSILDKAFKGELV